MKTSHTKLLTKLCSGDGESQTLTGIDTTLDSELVVIRLLMDEVPPKGIVTGIVNI
jgi:hypothetical protein